MIRLKSPRAAWVVLVVLALTENGRAGPRTNDSTEESTRGAPRAPTGLIGERFGYPRIERLLDSKHEGERWLAYGALARRRSPFALEKLCGALRSDVIGRDPFERLFIVRAAAPHARYRSLRDEFARILSEPARGATSKPKREPRGQPRRIAPAKAVDTGDGSAEDLLRQTAALALATYGGPEGTQILLRALHQGGPAARAAVVAFAAHPSLALGLISRDPLSLTREELEVLASREAVSVAASLERVVVESDPALQAQALLALHRLGNPEVGPVAAYWLEVDEVTNEQRRAALEILADSHHPDWPRRARESLASPSNRSRVLELLLRAPVPELAPQLGELVHEASGVDTARLVAAVAHSHSSTSVELLERWLRKPRLAALAAFALAELDMPRARRALRESLGDAAARRWAFRGGVIASYPEGRLPVALERELRRLERSAAAEERADAAWANTILHPAEPTRRARHDEPAVRFGAALALPLTPRAARPLAVRHLEGAAEQHYGKLLFGVLGDDMLQRQLTQPVLEGFLAGGGVLSAIAVTELARRGVECGDERTAAWLGDADPWFRMRAAKGLGLSRDSRASALLEQAYARELDPQVRVSIIGALGRHGRASPFATLELAEHLDPSSQVRAAARRARLGSPLRSERHAKANAWLSFVALASATGPQPRVSREVAIRAPSGELFAIGGAGEASTALLAHPPHGYSVRVQSAAASGPSTGTR